MGIQTIVTPSGERLVVIPEAEYEALVEAAEDAEDIRDYKEFQRKLENGEEELVPSDVVVRLLAGENRVKVWREFRGLTEALLAQRAGIAQAFLSQIETDEREGTAETMLKLAAELSVSVDDLVGQENVRVERLINRVPGLTVAEIASQLNVSESHVRTCSQWLLRVGRAVSREKPARLFPPVP